MEDYLIDDLIDSLLEGKFTTTTKIKKSTKIKRATSQLASVEARKRKDPLYNQMVKYRKLYFKYKEMLHKKYSARVRSKARK